jgi:hypothetical protein
MGHAALLVQGGGDDYFMIFMQGLGQGLQSFGLNPVIIAYENAQKDNLLEDFILGYYYSTIPAIICELVIDMKNAIR